MSRVSLVLAVAAGLTMAGPSFAADMYGAPPPAPGYSPYSPQPATSWNGVYAGVQFGNAWGSGSLDGAVVGAYAGINSNIGQNVIAGVEGDLSISGQTTQHFVAGTLYRHDSTWNASIRPRLGIGFDRIMPYATAGIAFADDSLKALGTSSNNTKIGYAAGAGVEALLADHISVKGEYLHTGFGDTTHTVGGTLAKTSASSDTLRAGVAYHF